MQSCYKDMEHIGVNIIYESIHDFRRVWRHAPLEISRMKFGGFRELFGYYNKGISNVHMYTKH